MGKVWEVKLAASEDEYIKSIRKNDLLIKRYNEKPEALNKFLLTFL